MKGKHRLMSFIVLAGLLSGCVKEPEACFNAKAIQNPQGEPIAFENCSKYGDRVEWDFGDGQFSEEENPSHIYRGSGQYVVIQRVFNEKGEDDFSRTINVGTYYFKAFHNTVQTDTFSNDVYARCHVMEFYIKNNALGSAKGTYEMAKCEDMNTGIRQTSRIVDDLFVKIHYQKVRYNNVYAVIDDTLRTQSFSWDLSEKLYYENISFTNADSSVTLKVDVEFEWHE